MVGRDRDGTWGCGRQFGLAGAWNLEGGGVGGFARSLLFLALLLVILDALQSLLGSIYLALFGSDERLFRC